MFWIDTDIHIFKCSHMISCGNVCLAQNEGRSWSESTGRFGLKPESKIKRHLFWKTIYVQAVDKSFIIWNKFLFVEGNYRLIVLETMTSSSDSITGHFFTTVHPYIDRSVGTCVYRSVDKLILYYFPIIGSWQFLFVIDSWLFCVV